jgi:hypothetical protein
MISDLKEDTIQTNKANESIQDLYEEFIHKRDSGQKKKKTLEMKSDKNIQWETSPKTR